MRQLSSTKSHEVFLAWKSRMDKTVTATFEVKVVDTISGKPGGIVVVVKRFVEGGDTHNVLDVEDLPEIMKEEVVAILDEKLEIHEDALDDDEVTYIRNPLLKPVEPNPRLSEPRGWLARVLKKISKS